MSLQMPLLLVVMAITMVYGNSGKLQSRKGKKGCVIVITLIMACFSGFRSWWMGDLIKYYTLFRNCNGPDWQSYLMDDPTNTGIRYFFRLVGQLGMKYEVAIFLIAAFSAIALGVLVYRYSPGPMWSYLMWIAMGFYLFTYSGLKQTIAMAFLMLAMIGILEKRFWSFLGLTLLASWFHFPALIFLPAYTLAHMKFGRTYLLVMAAFVAIVFLLRGPIVKLMTDMYYEDREVVASKTVGGRFLMMAFIMIVSMILRPLKKTDVIYNKVFNIMFMALALQIFSIYSNNFTRLADYYYQFVVLFMPLMLQTAKTKTYVETIPGQGQRVFTFTAQSYRLVYLGVALFALYYYSSLVDNSWAILNDFKFFWEIDEYALYGA